MFSRVFYLALGFAVGYLINTLRQNDSAEQVHPVASVESVPIVKAEMGEEPAAAEESSPEFLQQINGIGPAYAQRLFDGGIRSFEALANATAEELVALTKARSLAQAEDWIKQANDYLSE